MAAALSSSVRWIRRRSIFAESAAVGETRAGAAAGLLMALAAPFALVFRQPGTSLFDSFWAEDAQVFLGDALVYPAVDSVFRPHAGYMHFPPRAAAELATMFPLRYAAMVMAALNVVAVAGIVWFVFRATRHHVQSLATRLLIAAAVLAVPAAAVEPINNVTNLHWYLLYAAVWCLLLPNGRWLDVTAGAAVVAVAVVADPLTLLLAPLVVARVVAWPRRSRAHLVTVAFAVAALVQIAVSVRAPRMPATQPDDVVEVGKVFTARVVAASVAGERNVLDIIGDAGWLAVVAISLVVLVSLAAAVWYLTPGRRDPAVVFIAAGIAMFAVPMSLRWHPALVPGLGPTDRLGFGSRYFVVPNLVVVTVLLLLADRAFIRPMRRQAWLAIAGVLIVAVGWGRDFRFPNDRVASAAWSDALREARETCRRGTRATEVVVSTAPPGWGVRMRCDRVV